MGYRTTTTLLMLCLSLTGCLRLPDLFTVNLFPNACTGERYPQKYTFGRYPIQIATRPKSLHIGDTVFVSASFSRSFYDSLGKQPVSVNESVSVWLKLDQYKMPVASSNPFAVDTTIYKVFNQHFNVVIRKGFPIDVYRYSFMRTTKTWDLELVFIAKKKGYYFVTTSFDKVATGEDIRCMLGNVNTYGATPYFNATNNQIRQIYPIATPYTSADKMFGFIID